MLKTTFSALAVTAFLATGVAFAAEQTPAAPVAATSPTATTAAAPAVAKDATKAAPAKHHKAKAAPAESAGVPAKSN